MHCVTMSPSLVMLSEAKHLSCSLRAGSAKDLNYLLRVNSAKGLDCMKLDSSHCSE
jgi:hypothetical protein